MIMIMMMMMMMMMMVLHLGPDNVHNCEICNADNDNSADKDKI